MITPPPKWDKMYTDTSRMDRISLPPSVMYAKTIVRKSSAFGHDNRRLSDPSCIDFDDSEGYQNCLSNED